MAFTEVLYGHQFITADNCFMKGSCICGLRLTILNTDTTILYPPAILLLKGKIWFISRDFSFQIHLHFLFHYLGSVYNHPSTSSLLIHTICFPGLLSTSAFYLLGNQENKGTVIYHPMFICISFTLDIRPTLANWSVDYTTRTISLFLPKMCSLGRVLSVSSHANPNISS